MPQLTPTLRQEYENLFKTCQVKPARAAEVESTVDRLLLGRSRYESVGSATGVPWHFIGVIHSLECSSSFKQHLHNGDPLTARTVNVPKGRPRTGQPPFVWEDSARDSLEYEGFTGQRDWSLPTTLYRFEAYNGWGYRGRGVNTPYLWSFSQHYTKGKFVSDGTWSATTVSQQCGAAVLLRRMAERRLILFPGQPQPAPGASLVRYSTRAPSDELELARAMDLQRWLNTFPGVYLRVDGACAEKTSDAYKTATGHYLPGDPRA
jgi:lysozyme family protein